MKSVLFFNESLDGGGAERTLTLLVENLDKTKYKVKVVSETDGEMFTERIKNNSSYKCFATKPKNRYNVFKPLWNRLVFKFSASAPLRLVHRVLIGGRYDIEVAFCEGYSTRLIAASPNKKSRKIAWIHTDVINNPWSQTMYKKPEDEVACYRNYETVCCVSEQVLEAAAEKFGITEKAVLAYNPVDIREILEKSNDPLHLEPFQGVTIITAGRLTYQKAFDRLVRIAGRLKKENYRFRILALGKGEEYDNLRSLAAELGVQDYFRLEGYQENPYNYIKASDFFVCSSVSEGFSTIATECVILQKPVVTTDCSGMKELFGGLDCGIICENDEDALYEAVKQVLDNPEKLAEFSKNCAKRAEEFSLKARVERVEALFDGNGESND